ncbi:MAG: hypothetical protein QOF76_1070 [Solirubrobacteraceae bacterium]|jgi:hypothetical protein|nr:hypothetical protein [Solirubrobacteraceae bacterium]
MALTLPDGPSRPLTIARAAIGTTIALAPEFGAKLFQLDPDNNPQMSFLGRLFGIRNIVLAASLAGGLGGDMQTIRRVNTAVDAADLAALAVCYRKGQIPKPAAVLIAATAGTATVLGALSLST